MVIKITKSEYDHILNTLDSAREEFEVLVSSVDWYVTELDEMCLEAYTILKNAEVDDEA